MAHLAALWAIERDAHVEAFYQASAAAEEATPREWMAAVTIQKVWRGYASRAHISHLKRCAYKMEGAFLRWRDRRDLRRGKIAELKARRVDAYNDGATKLQALWRGYRSRTDIFDFRSRSQYLAERANDYVTMTQKLADYRADVLAAAAENEDKRRKEAYAERARREHFMLSTTAQIGVYSTVLGGPKPAVAEQDIKSAVAPLPPAAKRLSQSMRETQRHTHAVIPRQATARKPVQGPFLPPDQVWEMRNRAPKRSLRMETPYTHREDAEVADKQKEWRSRVTDAPFIPVNRRTRPLANISETKSVRAAEKFHDAPLLSPNAPLNRQFTYRRLDSRTTTKKKDFVVTSKAVPLCEEYGV